MFIKAIAIGRFRKPRKIATHREGPRPQPVENLVIGAIRRFITDRLVKWRSLGAGTINPTGGCYFELGPPDPCDGIGVSEVEQILEE
jgi:hypothetical protein